MMVATALTVIMKDQARESIPQSIIYVTAEEYSSEQRYNERMQNVVLFNYVISCAFHLHN